MPTASTRGRNSCPTMKLHVQWDVIARDTARPRMRSGESSGTSSAGIGPHPTEKQRMYRIVPSSTIGVRIASNAGMASASPISSMQIPCPVKLPQRRVLRPRRSMMPAAAMVPSRFTSPVTALASATDSMPACLNTEPEKKKTAFTPLNCWKRNIMKAMVATRRFLPLNSSENGTDFSWSCCSADPPELWRFLLAPLPQSQAAALSACSRRPLLAR
mmetsp:Transcript_16409/g.38947  ORF Transcript_16409/g.38947 Transcript_16409/m.38947 type:complete len:216 (+) Transcript_16409:486-1133(+)